FGHPFLPVDCAGGHQAAAPETPRFFLGSLCSLAVRISEINGAHYNRFCSSRILVPEWQLTQPRFDTVESRPPLPKARGRDTEFGIRSRRDFSAKSELRDRTYSSPTDHRCCQRMDIRDRSPEGRLTSPCASAPQRSRLRCR